MGWRVGPGPVFVSEWVTTSRRWQPYAVRALFVRLILLGMAIVQSDVPRKGPDATVSLGDLAALGESLFRTIAMIELTLVLLTAPALTAGAVCLDKARGTLDHMLATDLSDAEIVLGKLTARLLPMLGLIACTVPVLALAGLLGGIAPPALLGLFAVAIGCALVGCALAMALSVHGRKTQDAVMLSYMLILLWGLAPVILEIMQMAVNGKGLPTPPPGAVAAPRMPPSPLWGILEDWLPRTNPYYLALASYSDPSAVDATSYAGFLAGCLGASAALAVLATLRVRRVALRQAGRPAGVGRGRLSRALGWIRLPGPSLDGNPVAWREWHRARSSWMMRIAWALYAALGLVWVGMAAQGHWRGTPGQSIAISFINTNQVLLGLLLLSVGASTSLAEERARGSLDVLLSTPMPTRSILSGKWWGGFRRAFGVAIWPAATTAVLAHDDGYWVGVPLLVGLLLAQGAVITGLGLATATWVRRTGRAIALCVTVFAVGLFAWPMLLGLVGGSNEGLGLALLIGHPAGVMYATRAASAHGLGPIAPGVTREEIFLWTAGWIVALAVVAAAVFGAALVTFDACLGRIPDEGLRRPVRPRGRGSRAGVELLAVAAPFEGET